MYYDLVVNLDLESVGILKQIREVSIAYVVYMYKQSFTRNAILKLS